MGNFYSSSKRAKLIPSTSLNHAMLQRLYQYAKIYKLEFESISGGVYFDEDYNYALKVFGDTKHDKFLYETEINAYKKFETLNFDFVPIIYEFESISGSGSFILMEHCGRDLCNIGKLQYQSWARIVEFLVNSVDQMHAHGIAHGDIKTENLMMNSVGELKVIDLGFTSQGTKKNGIGTLPFVTPYNRDNLQNDKYAAALTLIELAGYYHSDVGNCCMYSKELCIDCIMVTTPRRYARVNIKRLLKIEKPNLIVELVDIVMTQLDIKHEYIIWDRQTGKFHYGNKIHENIDKRVNDIDTAWDNLKISIACKTSDVEE